MLKKIKTVLVENCTHKYVKMIVIL